jgi:hypothetical protein
MSKVYITEDEFDALPPETQYKYYYCKDCGQFYYKEKTNVCICHFPD